MIIFIIHDGFVGDVVENRSLKVSTWACYTYIQPSDILDNIFYVRYYMYITTRAQQ